MSVQLIVSFVEVAFDCPILEDAVHSFDMTVGPRMLGLRQPMINIVEGAGVLEGVRQEGAAA